MAEIIVPMTSKAFFKSEAEVKSQVDKLVTKKYGNLVKKASGLTNTPEDVITSFIFVESKGIPTAKNGLSTGLMQVNPPTIAETFYKEVERGRMSADEMAVIKRFLGKRADKLVLPKGKKRFSNYDFSIVTQADLFKPEFNIFAGSMLIRQLMDRFTENGIVRMDKVIVAYNTGTKVTKKAAAHKGDTDSLMKIIPSITASYITKVVGDNGVLTTLA